MLPGAVAATHRRNGAAVTALLCSVPVSGPSDTASSSGKDKAKKPNRLNIVGLDRSKQFLLHIVSGLLSDFIKCNRRLVMSCMHDSHTCQCHLFICRN